MFSFFKNVELVLTRNLDRRYRLEKALQKAGIPYTTRIIDPNAKPMDPEALTEEQRMSIIQDCWIYVNRNDLDKAQSVLLRLDAPPQKEPAQPAETARMVKTAQPADPSPVVKTILSASAGTVLFENVTAVLMDPQHTVLPGAFVSVAGGKITSVGLIRPVGDFERVIDGKGGILMPGLVNCHAHTAMTAMRGYGDGHDLQTWLNDYIFPVEGKWDDRSIRACTDLGLMEMIASGTTCIADMYMRMPTVGQAVADAGISANLCNGAIFFGEDFSPALCDDCRKQEELFSAWHGYDNGRIRVDAALHAEYTSAPALWEWIADFAKSRDLGMHVHISETQKEHEECLARRGKTPIQALAERSVFDVRAIAAHCVWTTPEDWAIMAQKGISAVHNPASNLKLGSGVAPIPGLRKAGVNVALGTDGVSSNNTTDLFEDMKLAALLQNGVHCDPLALTAWDALEMATVNGAKALGRNAGVIAVGRDADLILLDPDAPNLIPCHDAANNIAYAAHGSNVLLNMCRGKVIYEKGEFLTIDADKVRSEVREYAVPHLFDGPSGK